MAAPSTDRSVTVTVGTIRRIRVVLPPPRPQRLSVAATVGCTITTLARVYFGVVYLNDCPQQANIPNYLLAVFFIPLLMMLFVTLTCESDAAQLRGFKRCLLCYMGLTLYTCVLAGDWWVFSVYQPNYDPAAADGLYCDKTLYTFAFWNAVWETFVILLILVKLCKPAPANREFLYEMDRSKVDII